MRVAEVISLAPIAVVIIWSPAEYYEIFSESIQLNACDLIVPDDVVWDDEPSVCNAYMNRSIEVEIKNNGTKSQNYKIEVHI